MRLKDGVTLKSVQDIVYKLLLWLRYLPISPDMVSLGFIQAIFLYTWLSESGA